MTLTIPIADLCLLRAAARLGYENTAEQDRIIREIAPDKTKEGKNVRSR